jgi:hypothetical protein
MSIAKDRELLLPAPVVRGHGLMYEGAPHDASGRRVIRNFLAGGVSGIGRAKCACGALSASLPSAYKRKEWHRDHRRGLVGP